MRVVHVITSLRQGGAENVLFRLLSALPDRKEHVVVSLLDEGAYGAPIRALGTQVVTLGLPRSFAPFALVRLYLLLCRRKPEVVQTWMYHANLLGGVAARLAGVRSVIWGIRNSFAAKKEISLSARIAARIGAWLSPVVPAAIVCNSKRAVATHQAVGYRAKELVVIPNGLDLETFKVDRGSRDLVRNEWRIGDGEFLIGCVARWDPQKDHESLLDAVAQLASRRPRLKCVLVGERMVTSNEQLSALVQRFGLVNRVILAGPRFDIPSVMNALDLHVLSSVAESFPGVIAEAMACGTPCVTTDVGDAAMIVGDTGWVVPPRQPGALAVAMEVAAERIVTAGDRLGEKCRKRILQNFAIDRMAEAFVATWRRVAATAGRPT